MAVYRTFDVLAAPHHGATSDYDFADPVCTCERIDVDRYDASGCELCNPRSYYNTVVAPAPAAAIADSSPRPAIECDLMVAPW